MTNFVTVFPPNFVKSFAIPHNACAPVTYAIASIFDHLSSHAKSVLNPAICKHNPTNTVTRIPHRAPIIPAIKFVKTPINSYKENMIAISIAVKDFPCACKRTIIRTAPSVMVNKM